MSYRPEPPLELTKKYEECKEFEGKNFVIESYISRFSIQSELDQKRFQKLDKCKFRPTNISTSIAHDGPLYTKTVIIFERK